MTVTGTYICDDSICPETSAQYSGLHGSGHCWHESLARRLDWQGGPSANAAADIASWNALGTRREVAA